MVCRLIFKSILVLLTFVLLSSVALAQGNSGRKYTEEVLSPEGYVEDLSYKLIRGIGNIVTCPAEFPKQIVVTIRDRGPIGILLGPLKGVGMTAIRGVVGAWETLTFIIPNSLDGDFSPVLKPEFVWTPSERSHY